MIKNIGIDLGTANTLLYVSGKGIAMFEPSVVALEKRTGNIVAVGARAKRMLGKTPGSIVTFRPLKDGVIADFEITVRMLHEFFVRIGATSFFNKPNVIVSIPYGVTEVEKLAVENAAFEAGARNVCLVEEPIAAAIGAKLRVSGNNRGGRDQYGRHRGLPLSADRGGRDGQRHCAVHENGARNFNR